MKIKTIVAAFFIGVLMSISVTAGATTYYVSNDGNDSLAGTTEETAWKTLEKVSSTEFKAGDEILFEAGGIWNGQLSPQGNGEDGAPITIASYGEGAKPLINGGGLKGLKTGGAVNLYNQSWWTIKDIEITNSGDGMEWRLGINIYSEGINAEGYVIQNVTVHDVEGGGTLSALDKHWNGGIVIHAEALSATDKCIVKNVLIEDCTVYDVKRTGITVVSNWSSSLALKPAGYGTDVTVRNNTVHHIWGDGIIMVGIDGGLVEHNVAYETNQMSYNGVNSVNVGIWSIHSNNVVFRFNESYLCRTTYDGYGYDIDGDCDNITFEYNYSHDNDGGFILLVNHNTHNGIVRYNISQNDHQFQIACAHNPGASPTIWDFTGKIYNNTFYAKEPGRTKTILMLGRPKHTELYNNIFYVEADTVNEILTPYPSTVVRHHNLYYFGNSKNAYTVDEEDAIIGKDPKFIAAGTGGLGIDSVDGYKLFEDSPCIGSGYLIEDNGGRDYWGNEVSSSEAPNIGAYGGEGISYTSEEAIELLMKRDVHMKVGESTMTIKGVETQVEDRNADAVIFIKDGYAMIPLRKVAQALDLEVDWKYESRTVTLSGINIDMEYVDQSEKYENNGKAKMWSTAPVNVDGVMYVPLRDLAEEAGKTVVYKEGEIHITDTAKAYE